MSIDFIKSSAPIRSPTVQISRFRSLTFGTATPLRENLRYAYGEFGYINFTPVPSTTFNDEKELAFLEIDMDEGRQFYVSNIGLLGADPQVLNDLALTKGQIHDVRPIDLFLRKHLPGGNANDPRIQQRSQDERNGAVALTFDFRSRTE